MRERRWPWPGRGATGCVSSLGAIEWAAGVEALVMGKPSAAFFHELVASTGLAPEQCLMIGDDVEADVIGAMACGLRGCLVRTGKFRPRDLELLPPQAGLIDSIAEWRADLVQVLRQPRCRSRR